MWIDQVWYLEITKGIFISGEAAESVTARHQKNCLARNLWRLLYTRHKLTAKEPPDLQIAISDVLDLWSTVSSLNLPD